MRDVLYKIWAVMVVD